MRLVICLIETLCDEFEPEPTLLSLPVNRERLYQPTINKNTLAVFYDKLLRRDWGCNPVFNVFVASGLNGRI